MESCVFNCIRDSRAFGNTDPQSVLEAECRTCCEASGGQTPCAIGGEGGPGDNISTVIEKLGIKPTAFSTGSPIANIFLNGLNPIEAGRIINFYVGSRFNGTFNLEVQFNTQSFIVLSVIKNRSITFYPCSNILTLVTNTGPDEGFRLIVTVSTTPVSVSPIFFPSQGPTQSPPSGPFFCSDGPGTTFTFVNPTTVNL